MRIQQWTLDRIHPYPNNPRVNDDAVKAVAKSIDTFGFKQPLVVDTDGIIICGHTRFKAAQRLGLEKIPVHVAKDLTAEQIKAYRIADNKTAELAEWNPELLSLELADLLQQNYDVGMLWFDDDELAALLEPDVKDGLTDPDDMPERPDEAVTQTGDLWILGSHPSTGRTNLFSGHLDPSRILLKKTTFWQVLSFNEISKSRRNDSLPNLTNLTLSF